MLSGNEDTRDTPIPHSLSVAPTLSYHTVPASNCIFLAQSQFLTTRWSAFSQFLTNAVLPVLGTRTNPTRSNVRSGTPKKEAEMREKEAKERKRERREERRGEMGIEALYRSDMDKKRRVDNQ
jgi:hypothetical protein